MSCSPPAPQGRASSTQDPAAVQECLRCALTAELHTIPHALAALGEGSSFIFQLAFFFFSLPKCRQQTLSFIPEAGSRGFSRSLLVMWGGLTRALGCSSAPAPGPGLVPRGLPAHPCRSRLAGRSVCPAALGLSVTFSVRRQTGEKTKGLRAGARGRLGARCPRCRRAAEAGRQSRLPHPPLPPSPFPSPAARRAPGEALPFCAPPRSTLPVGGAAPRTAQPGMTPPFACPHPLLPDAGRSARSTEPRPQPAAPSVVAEGNPARCRAVPSQRCHRAAAAPRPIRAAPASTTNSPGRGGRPPGRTG